MRWTTLLALGAAAGADAPHEAPDAVVQAWLATAPRVPSESDLPLGHDSSLMQTAQDEREKHRTGAKYSMGGSAPSPSGRDYGWGSCYHYSTCSNMKNHNNNRINVMKDKVNKVPRDNDNNYNNKWGAYWHQYHTKNGAIHQMWQNMRNDESYEWNLGAATSRAGTIQQRQVMRPVELKFENVKDRFSSSKSQVDTAKADHDRVVTKENNKFLVQNGKDQANARKRSAYALTTYPKDVDMAKKFVDMFSATTLQAVAGDIANEVKLRAKWDKGLASGHTKLNQINSDLAALSTQVQNDIAVHEQKVEAFEDGEGGELPSLEEMMEDGENQADAMEEAEEAKIETFVDGEDTENTKNEALLEKWLEFAFAGGEQTQEHVEQVIEAMAKKFENNVDWLEANMTARNEVLKEMRVAAKVLVEEVHDKLDVQLDAIKAAEKRTGSIADEMLKKKSKQLSEALKGAERDITTKDYKVEALIKTALKEHTSAVSDAQKRLTDTHGEAIRAIVKANNDFVTPLFMMPKGDEETVKGVESTLAGVESGLTSDGEKLTAAQARVHKMTAKSNEIKDLEGDAEKGINDAKKALSDTKNKYAVDVQKAVLTDNKEVQKSQSIARGSIVSVRDELGTQISEAAEARLAATETMVSNAAKASTKLKGEVAQTNTAMGSREAQFEFNENELGRLRVDTQGKQSAYVKQAGEVKEDATFLKDELSVPINEALEGVRSGNEAALAATKGDLEASIEKSAAGAAEELEKVKAKVTAASEGQASQRQKRYDTEQALLTNITEAEQSNVGAQSQFQTSFGGIQNRVDSAAQQMTNILDQTEISLKGQAGNVNNLIHTTQEQFARQTGDAFDSFNAAMSNLRMDFSGAGQDAELEASQQMEQNSKDSEGATAQAERGLADEADAVGQLSSAADSPIGSDAVNAAEAAANLVNGASGAADDTIAAAQAGMAGVSSDAMGRFGDAGSEADNQLNAAQDQANGEMNALGDQLSSMFGAAEGDALSASDTENGVAGGIGDAVGAEAAALARQGQEENAEGQEEAEALEGAAAAELQEQGLGAAEIAAVEGEANDEAHRSEGATAEAMGGISAAGAIVDEQVNEVEQEEESRVEKLNPAWRLDKMDKDMDYLRKDLEGQQGMVETEAQNVMESEETMSRAAQSQIPNIKSRISLLKPDVLASPKATMDRLEGLRREMSVVMKEISDRGFEAQSQANSAKLAFDGKEEKLRRALERTESDVAEAMEMAQYSSEDAMNRVAHILESGLAQDKELNEEIETNVQPKTDDYRWRINNVYRALGRDIDMDEIMGQANQSMQAEMALRDRLSGSGEDIEKYIAQTQKLAKAKIDSMYNEMLAKISAVMHDNSLNEYEKAARIAMLKEQAKAGREQLSSQVSELAGAQFEEMQSLDDKANYATTLAQRAAAAAKGDESRVTSGQMQGFFGDLRKKFKGLDDHYNSDNLEAGGSSLLETDEAPAAPAVDELRDEARNLRVTHDREEKDVSSWMEELQQMGKNAI